MTTAAGHAPAPHTPNRPATLNRTLLTLAGLVLLLAGAYPLVRGLDVLTPVLGPTQTPDDTLLPAGVTAPGWLPYLVIVGAAIIGLLCLAWLLVQARRRSTATTWRLGTDPDCGRTHLDTTIAAAALADDVTAYPGITAASATITGPRTQPELHLRVTIEDQARVSELRERIDTHALPRLRHALECDVLPTDVLIRAGAAPTSARTR